MDFGFLVATSHVETAFYFSSGGVTDMPLVGLPRERGRLRLHLRLRFFFAGAWGVGTDKVGLTWMWPPLASLQAAPSLPLEASGQPPWERG